LTCCAEQYPEKNIKSTAMAAAERIKDEVCFPKITASYDFYSEKYLKDVTNDQVADGVDEFYKDYRNRKIRIHDAVWLTLNAIAGTPKANLDKMIETFRKNAD